MSLLKPLWVDAYASTSFYYQLSNVPISYSLTHSNIIGMKYVVSTVTSKTFRFFTVNSGQDLQSKLQWAGEMPQALKEFLCTKLSKIKSYPT